MFDQFKNILPTTNINIRSLSSSVGLEALRSEFQNLNSLLLNRQQNASYEHDWQDIHDRNTVNFEKARMADQLLLQLLNTCRQHVSTGDRMEKTNDDLMAMHEDLKQLNTLAGKSIYSLDDGIKTHCYLDQDDLKSKLMNLEDRIDEATSEQSRLEFEEWKQEQRSMLKEDIANKTAQLEMYEASLRQAYEEHHQVQTQKRAELLDATFNAEMEQYRRMRETQVSSLYSRKYFIASNQCITNQPAASITASLDTLKLDVDDQDLDSFLSDNEEKPETRQHPPHKQQSLSDNSSDEGGDNEILGDEDYEDL
ncbi:hypothetical protein K492DRAFT_180635 [Lichtheimia hyalospora FSU 10163]|nr:hypothetical protein K492DRAFT_180635 [Lichtheimia hyalospora FSU 10163]